MAQAAFLLTALSGAQRIQALQRLTIIRPALEKKVPQAQVVRTHQFSPVVSNSGSHVTEKRGWLDLPMLPARTKANLAIYQSKRSSWSKGLSCRRLHVHLLIAGLGLCVDQARLRYLKYV